MAPVIPISQIIIAAAPLARDLITLIIEAVEAAQGEDVSLAQIDSMMGRIEEKNEAIQALVAGIRAERGEG